MTIIVKSKIEKGSIRLPKKVDLPDGTRVVVRIEPVIKIKEKLKIISELSGAWSDDPTITPIFRAIDQERHRYFGGEIALSTLVVAELDYGSLDEINQTVAGQRNKHLF